MDGVVVLTKVKKKARVRAMDVVSDLHVRNAISGNLLAGVARTYSLRRVLDARILPGCQSGYIVSIIALLTA